jgi:hypothetical protein
MNKRKRNGTLIFEDHPEFTPNLTPAEIFSQGAFGGTYWRPIYSSVNKRAYRNKQKKYKFLLNIPKELLISESCDVSKNKYKVISGTSLEYWEEKGWINPKDPYGWVQWYCEFYSGRRTNDDDRQISRWLKFAGPSGRFLRRLVNMVRNEHKRRKGNLSNYVRDSSISPVIRQGLHQWAKRLVLDDF